MNSPSGALAVLILGVLLLRIGLVCLLPINTAEQFAFRMLPTRADDLLVGGTLALLLRGPAPGKWLRQARLLSLAGIAGFVIPGLWRGNFAFQDSYNLTIGLTFLSAASAGLIALAIQETTAIFRFLSLGPLRMIGKYSYGFYIYHVLFNRARVAYFIFCMAFFHSMVLAGLFYAGTCYLTILLVSGLSYELYEKRFLAMKSRFQSLQS